MTYFRDSTESAYREYCAKIVGLQNRFSQHDRDRIVREFLSEGLNAKEVAFQYHLSSAQLLYQWVGHYIEESQIMRKTKDFTDEEFKAMTPQEQLMELKRL